MPPKKPLLFKVRPLRAPASLKAEDLGVAAILGACVLNALVGAAFFHAYKIDTHLSAATGVFIRVLANLSCLLIPLYHTRRLPPLRPWRGNRSLWLWAFFGILTTSTFYLSLPLVGSGLSMFLNAGSGIFIVALAPLLAGQKSRPVHWLGVIGSFAGLFLLGKNSPAGASAIGALLAVVSGFFGGLALLMVARARKNYSPDTVMYHWTVANLVAYTGFFFFVPPVFPAESAAWGLLLAGGLMAAISQYLTSFAYQRSPAPLVACLSYLGPVLSLSMDAAIFGVSFSSATLLGAALVLGFGLVLPIMGAKGGHGRFAR